MSPFTSLNLSFFTYKMEVIILDAEKVQVYEKSQQRILAHKSRHLSQTLNNSNWVGVSYKQEQQL